ncbi:PAS domain S-box protein [Synechococcus sp. CBW1004]|uniref:sensor domain-containing diguanylate cyclase n=1 Tax=Synechococcus sp. CBW1004 TaxID=1353136 RepID=UPI0018CC8F48|nr:PAS domain S-box protein [Synechococcus sp. CBW1004]QPN64070.1 PAS domain S-box protein [Synechococcus sp. CBW1004]
MEAPALFHPGGFQRSASALGSSLATAMDRWLPCCRWRCRFTLLVFAPSAAVLLLAASWLAHNARQQVLTALKLHQTHAIALANQSLKDRLAQAEGDLDMLTARPELQRWLAEPSPANRAALAQLTGVVAEASGHYDQIRWLDAAGREQVRINWRGGRATPLAADALHDKSRRYYVIAAKQLAPGSTYISPLDLNVENGRIETPEKPVLRLLRPIAPDPANPQRLITLVLNLLGQPLLESFSAVGTEADSTLLLLNRRGFALYSPDGKADWGFMTGKPAAFPRRDPAAWRLIQAQTNGQQLLASGLWTWQSLHPFQTNLFTSEHDGSDLRPFDTRPRWIAVSHISAAQLAQRQWAVTQPIAISTALGLAALAGFSAWVGRRLERGHQADSRLALVAQNAANVIYAADAQGRLIWVSDSTQTQLALDPSTLLGRPLAALLLEDDRPLAEQAQAQLSQGQTATFQGRILDGAGVEHWLEISSRSAVAADCSLQQAGAWRLIDIEHQQQQALDQAQQHMAAVTANAPVGMVLTTADGRFVEVNPAFCAMLGLNRQQLLASTWQKITYPADLDDDLALVQQILKGERNTYRRRKRFLHADGHVICGDLSVATLRRDDSVVESFIAQVIDISRSVKTEQQLRQAREHYRLLAENAADVVLKCDHRHQLSWISPSAAELFGSSTDSILNSALPDWLHPDDRQAFQDYHQRLARQLAPTANGAGQLLRLRTGGGSDRWVALRMQLLRDRGHAIQGAVISLRDVHEMTIARQQLDSQRLFLRATLDSLLDPQLTLDPLRNENGRIVDFLLADGNSASYAFLGQPASRLLGRTITSIFPGVAKQGLLDCYRNVMDSGEPLLLTDFVYTDQEVLDRDLVVDLSAVRAADSLSLTWRDVSERYSKAQALAASEERYRLLTDNAIRLIVRIRDNRLIWLSNNAQSILGAPPEQWIGRSVQELLHPDDLALTLSAQTALQQGGAIERQGRLLTADGTYHWFSIAAKPFLDAHGTPDGFQVSLCNIDQEVAAAAELDYRASHDLLTGLLNRNSILERLEALLADPDPRAGSTGVLFIDVDKFKQVNDTCGHAAGDAALITLADRIRHCLRQNDLAGRMGGDELLVVFQGLHAREQATAIAEKLRAAGCQPIPHNGGNLEVSLSIGVAIANPGETVDTLIARADAAMYSAKQGGRNQVITIDTDIDPNSQLQQNHSREAA